MNEVATALKDLAISEVAPTVLHLVHPQPTPWSTIIKHAAEELNIPLVSYTAWLDALDKSMSDKTLSAVAQRRRDPALRLRSVFHGRVPLLAEGMVKDGDDAFRLPKLDMTEMNKFSPALTSLKPLDKQDVLGWFNYWKSIDML
jgi:hypothetical protein